MRKNYEYNSTAILSSDKRVKYKVLSSLSENKQTLQDDSQSEFDLDQPFYIFFVKKVASSSTSIPEAPF